MNKILFILFILFIIFILSITSVFAGLGTYKSGETITYSVVCLTNEGLKDIGCSGNDDDILDPDDTTAKAPTSALAEVSDANFPGLWRGSYLIPSTPTIGTWSIYLELTNSNSTTGATVLHFLVSDTSFNDLDNNFSTVIADTNEIQGAQNWDVWNDETRTLTTADWITDTDLTPLCFQTNLTSGIIALTSATETQIDNIETDTNEIQGNQSYFLTATGFETEISASSRFTDTQTNLSTITGYTDSVESNQATLQNQITQNTSAIITRGNIAWITATGFSTHSAADIWTSGTRTLTTADWITDTDLTPLCFQTNLTSGIIALTSATETQIDNIETDTNEIQGNQSKFITATGFSTHNESDIWNVLTRELTYYPSTQSVLSLDITKSGALNLSAFDNIEPQYFYGKETPTNELNTGKYYSQKFYHLIDIVPSNITELWLKSWMYYTGSPTTDRIEIYVEGTNLLNISTANLTTGIAQYTWSLGDGSVITDEFVKVELKGFEDHSPGNEFTIGYGDSPSQLSYQSSDGSTYTKTSYENANGFIIQYNQKSIAEDLNSETHRVIGREIQTVCPGENVIAQWKIRDFSGDSLDLTSANASCKVDYFEDDSGTLIAVVGETISSTLHDNEDLHVIWNNTDTATEDVVYHLECNISWASATNSGKFISHKNLIFSRDCDVQKNLSTVISEVDDLEENTTTINTNINSILIDTGTTLPEQITQNTSAIMENASTERASLMTYLVSTISSLLTTLDSECISDSELNDSHGIGYYDLTGETISEADKNSIANKVWAWVTGYVNPDSDSLNASDTLKQIAENSEEGGW